MSASAPSSFGEHAGLLRRGHLIFVALAVVLALLPALLGASRAEAAAAKVDGIFTPVQGLALGRSNKDVSVRPKKYSAFEVDLGALKRRLQDAPTAKDVARRAAAPLQLRLPNPAGGLDTFEVVEDSILEPGLAAAHPEIATFAGRDLDDPTRTIRADLTPLGFHASVRMPTAGDSWYIDPAYNRVGAAEHLAYTSRSVPRRLNDFVEKSAGGVLGPTAAEKQQIKKAQAQRGKNRSAVGEQNRTEAGQAVTLRTYRLALATDPSYADYFGSDQVLAAKTSLMNRVNQIYNDDFAIEMVLVGGTDDLNFATDAQAYDGGGQCGANGCYTADSLNDGCTSGLLSRHRFVLGQIIGADNYDIGHIMLGINGGGIAGLGVVGESRKAAGCTGLPFPEGDFMAIDYVAHEMGHQFNGNHTFDGITGACSATNRNGGTSVEPGSGSSVMAYAGICSSDDLQPHTDPYFSQRSLDEVDTHVTAEPFSYEEIQIVNLNSFDTDGDSITLTYADRTTTIVRGAEYNVVSVQAKLRTLTGEDVEVTPYDGQGGGFALTDAGFTVTWPFDFIEDSIDAERIGFAAATGAVTAFLGVEVEGGPATNQGAQAASVNHAPSVTAPADKTLPLRTPFELTGSGSDIDDDILIYLWEQNDQGLEAQGTGLVSNNKRTGPLFRVFGTYADVSLEDSLLSPSPGQNLADTSATRTFPDLQQILDNNTNAATGSCPAAPANNIPLTTVDCYSEFLPTANYAPPVTGGELNFRLTARDLYPTAGGTQFDDVTLTLAPNTGPFLVSSRNSEGSVAAVGGQTENITWDVAGTNTAALATTVDVLLSVDGGRTYPIALASGTANDGATQVTWPAVETAQARIKIAAVGNYFFDLNNADFTIKAAGGDVKPPQTAITDGPENNGFRLNRNVPISYSSSEPGSSFECTLDGQDVDCSPSAVALKKLSQGTHTFTVAARDQAGNVDTTPASVTWSRPFSIAALDQKTTGWTRIKANSAYTDKYLRAVKRKQKLTLDIAAAKKVALVAGTSPGSGRVKVILDGEKVGVVDLGRSKDTKVIIDVVDFAVPVSGRLKLVTLDNDKVRIEGVGVISSN